MVERNTWSLPHFHQLLEVYRYVRTWIYACFRTHRQGYLVSRFMKNPNAGVCATYFSRVRVMKMCTCAHVRHARKRARMLRKVQTIAMALYILCNVRR